MYRPITLEEDLALKQVIATRHSDGSHLRYNWCESLATEYRTPIPEITVTRPTGER